jgi:hypothetical protein
MLFSGQYSPRYLLCYVSTPGDLPGSGQTLRLTQRPRTGRAQVGEPKWEPPCTVTGLRGAMSGERCRRQMAYRATSGYARRPAGVDLGAGGPRFESGHPDHKCSSEACHGLPGWLARSSDRHLTVRLNADRRYCPSRTGSHGARRMGVSMDRVEQIRDRWSCLIADRGGHHGRTRPRPGRGPLPPDEPDLVDDPTLGQKRSR